MNQQTYENVGGTHARSLSLSLSIGFILCVVVLRRRWIVLAGDAHAKVQVQSCVGPARCPGEERAALPDL